MPMSCASINSSRLAFAPADTTFPLRANSTVNVVASLGGLHASLRGVGASLDMRGDGVQITSLLDLGFALVKADERRVSLRPVGDGGRQRDRRRAIRHEHAHGMAGLDIQPIRQRRRNVNGIFVRHVDNGCRLPGVERASRKANARGFIGKRRPAGIEQPPSGIARSSLFGVKKRNFRGRRKTSAKGSRPALS